MERKEFIIFIVLVTGLILAGCGTSPETSDTVLECPDCPECPEIDCPVPLGGAVPFELAWASSGHAESEAEAFRHWDEEETGLVGADCLKCHTTAGYVDFHGGDGTETGTIENNVMAKDLWVFSVLPATIRKW